MCLASFLLDELRFFKGSLSLTILILGLWSRIAVSMISVVTGFGLDDNC